MDELRYVEAIEAYTRGYAAYPDPALLYNRGRAHQARGEYVEALRDFERFRDTAPDDLRGRVPRLDELIQDVRGKMATLVVVCRVRGAQVSIDGVAVGACPLKDPIEVAAAEIEIEATADGYHPYRRRIELVGGQTKKVAIELGLVKQTGLLKIRGPSNSEVFVDGKYVGRAPAELTVAPGRHKVVLRRPAYREAQATVVVDAGEDRGVRIDPKDRAPLATRWWFWTGIGVGVAAGAVTAALLIEKPPDEGEHFSPNRVSGPLVIDF